jgi:hypothetical protein
MVISSRSRLADTVEVLDISEEEALTAQVIMAPEYRY